MKFLKILITSFFILSGCEDLPFTDEDIFNTASKLETAKRETKGDMNDFEPDNESPFPENQKEISITIEERESVPDRRETKTLNIPIVEGITESLEKEVKVSITDNSLEDNGEGFASDFTETKEKVIEWKISRRETERQIPESELQEEIKPLSEDEITLISEELELKEDTVIQNRKVVLDMLTVYTLEHDLIIKAEEFVSNHSLIQNFPEGQKSKKGKAGRSGGNILIETETATGELQLVLNGEEAGRVPNQRFLSRKERGKKLKGRRGESGRNAVYKTHCRSGSLSLGLGPVPIVSIPLGQKCLDECVSPPTAGQNGGNGLKGLPGSDGKNGGSSGSFHLKAFELSDFHLTSIQNNPGIGSKGERGSLGGWPGVRGRNGRDAKKLCNYGRLPPTSKGKKGKRGPSGKDGENGRKGTVCLEKLLEDSSWKNEREESRICY